MGVSAAPSLPCVVRCAPCSVALRTALTGALQAAHTKPLPLTMKYLLTLLILCLPFIGIQAQPTATPKISPTLLHKAQAGKPVETLIWLTDQAHIQPIQGSKQQKGQYVFNTLYTHAQRTQQSLIQNLQQNQIPYRSYYIANVLWVRTNLPTLQQLATRPDVAYLSDNVPTRVEQPLNVKPYSPTPQRTGTTPTWGVSKIGAPAIWDMGYQGENIVIGGQDTGYDWEHPAIKTKYRGWNGSIADHNYNWHDAIHEVNENNSGENPCGLNITTPCDDNDHGTHTMGTMVGESASNAIGVAPKATWIACRNMERGWGKPSTYIECFEWFLAPTDLNNLNPNPDKSPHVINNSWSCPPSEGCDITNFALMQTVVDNLKNAGIVVVVSAGNSGSNCNTIDTPAAIFDNSFTIGASDALDTLAGFSSRGSVTADNSNRTKPNISAPGVGVLSSIPGGLYSYFSGTSMAGPHVAGAVALLLSARPDLIGNVEAIESLLEQTAKPIYPNIATWCNEPTTVFPNNHVGYGRMSIYDAIVVATVGTTTPTTSEVRVFPNPAGAHLYVNMPTQSGAVHFELYDAVGRVVLTHNWIQPLATTKIDLPQQAGIYLYKVQQGTHTWTGKVLVQ